MRITMVGTGYVGLVTGTCLANTGNVVTCLDIDRAKIDKLNRGVSPIYEPGLDELISRNVKAHRLLFTTEKWSAYQDAQIILICVGTPSDAQGQADLQYVLAAAEDIGCAMEQAPGESGGSAEERRAQIIVVKSTVPVGTSARVKARIAQFTGKTFRMASNPEFLKEGAAINDFNKPDRVVIGCEDKGTGDRLRDLYEPFVRQGNPIFIMDIPSAEMVKYAANAMLAVKISFINEIANLCERYGADIDEVRRGMCSDRRIGNQFLYPGLGYGGSCFPKDVLACISMGEQSQSQTVLTIMQHLLASGAQVTAHDPVAHESCRRELGNQISYVDSAMDVLDDADALIICTDWDEFRHPDFDEMKSRMKSPVIFDGRNLYRLATMRQAGFTYYSVGRQASDSHTS